MKKYYKYLTTYLLKSELLGSASVLVTGTVIAQLISIILQPFLRRYFSPENFGLFSVYMSLVGIILIVTTLRYDDAIVLPKKDKESINVLTLSVLISFLLNSLLLLSIVLWGKSIIKMLNLPGHFPLSILYLIPLSVFLYNTFQSFNYWLIRKKKYYIVSVNKLVRRGSEGFVQVYYAIIKNGKGLVYGDIIGQFANVTFAILHSVKQGFTYKQISLNKLLYVFRKYSEFPKYNLIPAFMSACSYLLPPIFIIKYYSAEYTGYFDLSKLLLSIPLALIATSIANVLLQKISEKYRNKESFWLELKPLIFIVCFICFFEILIISFFGIELFCFVFGDKWEMSGVISKILVWSFTLNFIVSSFTSIFISMRKIKTYSVWQLIYFMSILSLLFFKKLNFIDFLWVYVMIEVLCYLALSVVIIYIVVKYEKSLKLKESLKK